MRRSSNLLILGAMTAALILPISAAAATTTVTYDVAGVAAATLFPVSLTGVAASESKTERGVWTAGFQPDLGAILAGTFTFKSKARTFEDTIVGGTFGQPFGSPPSGTCARTTIPVHASLSGGGFFDVTLTRYGSLMIGSCVVYLTTVLGKATLVFPS